MISFGVRPVGVSFTTSRLHVAGSHSSTTLPPRAVIAFVILVRERVSKPVMQASIAAPKLENVRASSLRWRRPVGDASASAGSGSASGASRFVPLFLGAGGSSAWADVFALAFFAGAFFGGAFFPRFGEDTWSSSFDGSASAAGSGTLSGWATARVTEAGTGSAGSEPDAGADWAPLTSPAAAARAPLRSIVMPAADGAAVAPAFSNADGERFMAATSFAIPDSEARTESWGCCSGAVLLPPGAAPGPAADVAASTPDERTDGIGPRAAPEPTPDECAGPDVGAEPCCGSEPATCGREGVGGRRPPPLGPARAAAEGDGMAPCPLDGVSLRKKRTSISPKMMSAPSLSWYLKPGSSRTPSPAVDRMLRNEPFVLFRSATHASPFWHRSSSACCRLTAQLGDSRLMNQRSSISTCERPTMNLPGQRLTRNVRCSSRGTTR
mmetsp:Transcript_31353/g.96875  ORF Transcript_31353/g.96875 Transcript_31353/m.96875 type:complete len:439 (+) Transcript_31353:191-1507(+)